VALGRTSPRSVRRRHGENTAIPTRRNVKSGSFSGPVAGLAEPTLRPPACDQTRGRGPEKYARAATL
jgi:hypothetical protein